MPFKIKQSAAYWWPVSFSTPAEDRPGQRDEHRIEVQFKRLDDDAHDALMKRSVDEQLKDREILPELVRGWRNVLDEHDNEQPFSPEKLTELLRVPGVPGAIMLAYLKSRFEAAEKNSGSSPALGLAAT